MRSYGDHGSPLKGKRQRRLAGCCQLDCRKLISFGLPLTPLLALRCESRMIAPGPFHKVWQQVSSSGQSKDRVSVAMRKSPQVASCKSLLVAK